MRFFVRAGLLAFVLFVVPFAAHAQITLEFGRSDASTIEFLRQRGFSDIAIVDRDILKIRVEGCREGVRYRFKLRADGRIYDEAKIGECGRAITLREAQRIASEQGLRNPQVREQGDGFVATGCAGQNRMRLVIASNGDVLARDRDGACRPAFSIDGITGLLQGRGYDRISILNQDAFPVAADACLDGVKYRLRISDEGEILDRRVLGDCAKPITVRQIDPILRERGYDRIEIIDPQPPRYRVHACRARQRIEIVLDIFGRNIGEQQVGDCNPRLDPNALTNILLRQGFYRIAIDEGDRRRFSAKACYAQSEMKLTYTIFGDLVNEEAVGKCPPMSVADLARAAAARGLKEPQVFAEGCRAGKRVRVRTDDKGGLIEREVPGGAC